MMTVLTTIDWPQGIELHLIDTPKDLEQWTPSLTKLLQSCINDDPPSSSLGFHAPLSTIDAAEFWLSLSPQLFSSKSRISLFVLTRGSSAIGTVHLVAHPKATHAHKVEVAKLLISTNERRLGLGRKLMEFSESFAKEKLGKSMVMLDTATETPARGFYLKLGYTEWGVCPSYAESADGHLHDCSFFYKILGD
jgi:ribosomal protein S18 acetylase RimI-like enzyme